MEASQYDIFISYARVDGLSLAKQLYQDLSERGFQIWWDKGGGIPYGKDFTVAIQEGIRNARYFVLLMTPGAIREDGFCIKELGYAILNQCIVLPLMHIDCIPPIQIVNANWIDARNHYTPMLETLIAALQGQQGKMWRYSSELNYQAPPIFIGRRQLIEQVEAGMQRVNHEGSFYLITGKPGVGKTTFLQHLKALHTDQSNFYILLADFSAQAAQTSGDHDPQATVLRMLWTQLLMQSERARQYHAEIKDSERTSHQMIWLRRAIEKASQEKPVLILLDNLHRDSTGLFSQEMARLLRGYATVVVATHTDQVNTDELRYWTHTVLSPLQPFELGYMFTDPDVQVGYRIQSMSDGMPSVVLALITYWLQEGIMEWQHGKLRLIQEVELPDIWEGYVEVAVADTIEDLSLDLDENEVFDLLTCAAIEGVSFHEQTLLAVMAEDIPQETVRQILHYLAHTHQPPILQPTQSLMPFSSQVWKFYPIGIRDLLLQTAEPEDVAYYGIKLFEQLEQTAHPQPMQIKEVLLKVAETTLEYMKLHLAEKGTSMQEVAMILSTHPAMQQLKRYQGYKNREQTINNLKIHLATLEAIQAPPASIWPLRQRLGWVMYGYKNNYETLLVFQQAHMEALLSQAEHVDIGYLYYLESLVSDEKVDLLLTAWSYLPAYFSARTVDHFTGNPQINEEKSAKQLAGFVLVGMGDVQRMKWQLEAALTLYEQALPLIRQVGDVGSEAVILRNMGDVRREQRQLEAALALYEQALPLIRQVGDVGSEAVILRNMGDVGSEAITLASMGDARREQWQLEAALTLYEQALPLIRKIGDMKLEAIILNKMGDVRRLQQQLEAALTLYEQALSLKQQIGDVHSEAITLASMGDVRRMQRQLEAALTLYEQALPLIRQVGDVGSEAVTLTSMGEVQREQRQFDAALTLYEQALPLLRQVGDVRTEAFTLRGIGEVRREQQQLEAALTLYEQALPLIRQAGDVGSEAIILYNMGEVRQEQRQFDAALTLYEQALPLLRQVGDVRTEAFTLHNMADIQREQRQLEAALTLYEQALHIKRQIGDVREEAIIMISIAEVRRLQRQFEAAFILYEQGLVKLQSQDNDYIFQAVLKSICRILIAMKSTVPHEINCQLARMMYSQARELFTNLHVQPKITVDGHTVDLVEYLSGELNHLCPDESQ